MPSNKKSQQGFTLIEVLVALVVLSFGMLGLVGMQAFAMQSNREAKFYLEATNLGRELAEMMRGNNLIAIKSTKADNPYLTDSLTVTSGAGSCLTVGSTCASTKEVAQAQMADWLNRVNSTLPGARVSICFDTEPYEKDSGLPQWSCTTSASNSDIVVLKIGWTLRTTNQNISDEDSQIKASDTKSRPQIIIPVNGGNPFDL